LEYWIVGLLDCWIVGLLEYWIVEVLDFGGDGVLGCFAFHQSNNPIIHLSNNSPWRHGNGKVNFDVLAYAKTG
jgi:hypothetical protein